MFHRNGGIVVVAGQSRVYYMSLYRYFIKLISRTTTVDPRFDNLTITYDSFWALPFAAPPIGIMCGLFSMQCVVCSMQYEVCSVHCVVCSVHCALCSVQCAVCTV